MKQGDIVDIFVDERTKRNKVGTFKLLEKLEGNYRTFEYWLAENVDTKKIDKYLIAKRN